jgi:hypothetical protein
VKTARDAGWAAFSEHGTAPRWLTGARVVLVVAFALALPGLLVAPHGNRVFWTVAIASLPVLWLVAGVHVWRRACPLAVAGQLGRLLGRPGARKIGGWANRHAIALQLAVMVGCLSLRLVATNGSGGALVAFLVALALAAAVTSFVYTGKSW